MLLNHVRFFCDPIRSSAVFGISQAGKLEGIATSFSRGSSPTRDQARVSGNGRQMLYHWATREAIY